MGDKSLIEWTDATWNVITGCSVHSPGCTNCYAMRNAGIRLRHSAAYKGLTQLTKAGPVWTGEVRLNERILDQPLRWGRPRKIFVCASGDLFHENVPDEWIDQVFDVMEKADRHVFQVLTKRADRMHDYLSVRWRLPDDLAQDIAPLYGLPRDAHLYQAKTHIWLGVSAEDQTRASDRIPVLLATPAAIRFASIEPMLGPMDLRRLNEWTDDFADCGHPEPQWAGAVDTTFLDGLTGRWDTHVVRDNEVLATRADGVDTGLCDMERGLDWVILGGESGLGARPMHPDWVRSLRDQCAVAGVPFFFKQWGNYLPEGQFDKDRFEWCPGNSDPRVHWWRELRPDEPTSDGCCSIDIGKKKAGHYLDGVEHLAMPGFA